LVNSRRHGYEPGFYRPEHRLAVEVDGFGAHGGRSAFERDRRRDQVFAAAGIHVLRATRRQIDREPIALELRIERRSRPGPLEPANRHSARATHPLRPGCHAWE
jgi:very-short-patch-repair endonuclease